MFSSPGLKVILLGTEKGIGMELDDEKLNQEAELHLESGKPVVLVADSHPDFRRNLKSVLELRFIVFVAADLARSVGVLSRIGVDAILGPDLEFMKSLRQDPKFASIPFLLLTTSAEESSRIEALEAGVDEYLTRPFSDRELLARLSTIIRARQQQLKVIKELQNAGRIQRSLLPPLLQSFGDVQLSALFLPSEELSGDFFDSRQSGQWVYYYLADVTGHGFAAAQVTLLLKELFHGALDYDAEMGLVELLKWIARKYSTYQLEKDLAVQIVRYHLKERRIEYVRANAPAAVRIQPDGVATTANVKAGPTISTGSSHYFDPKKFHVHMETLKPGDSLYLFTDGAYELGEMENVFGRRKFIEMLSQAPVEGWQKFLMDSLTRINGNAHFSDDVTVIRLDVQEFKKALIVVQEAKVGEEVRAGLESNFPGFQVSLAPDIEKAIQILEDAPFDAVIVQGATLENLPTVRRFATILISSIPQLSLERALAGRVDLVFSEQIDFNDLIEAVRNPSVQREKQWRRLMERVVVKARLDVELSEIGEIRKGDVVNIGLGGMFVGITFPMPEVGEKISFRLKFGEASGSTVTIEGVGLIRWTRSRASESLPVGCGVQFLALTETSIENLRRILSASKVTEMIPLC